MLEKTQFYLQTNISFLSKSDIKKLSDVLDYHSDLYHNKETPEISDSEYDALLKKLEVLEEKFWVKNKKSVKVWETVVWSTFEKVAHTRPMISLDNTYNEEDLLDFDTRVKKRIESKELQNLEYCLEYKFDGLWIELIYRNWIFVQAITRGNGIEWEDVTENIKWIKNIPQSIDYSEYLEIRGEVVMPISIFEKINEKAKQQGTKIFSNPRNAASWSVRMKDASITQDRELQFFAYDIGNFHEYVAEKSLKSYNSVIYDLKLLWFDISSYFQKFSNIQWVIHEIHDFSDYKKHIDFEVDGLVLKTNDISLWEEIGFTEHHPRYAIAYKFPAEIFTTTILSVDHQIGRTGTITPAANLEPVNMNWAIIRRATLHNYEEVQKLWVKTWDRVFIKRAGEVIPKIISVAKSTDSWTPIFPPKNCPSCKAPIIKDEDKVRFYCPNHIYCPKQISEQLIYAVGKWWFNIDGMGERQVEVFLEKWIIKNLADIFTLAEKQEHILALEGFQEKSVKNILKAIKKVKNTKIDILLRSLWISWVGKKTAKNLSVLFSEQSDLLNFSHSLDNIEQIDDIGPEVARNISEYFTDTQNRELLQQLTKLLEIEYYKKPIVWDNSFFSWKTVCITGSFEKNWEKVSRDSLIEQLEKAWGAFTGSVSKKTDFLLAGEKAGSKLTKATTLWVEILDLEKFYAKIL